jgi:Asp-tRNA(Asn)/Glu-tRNA(Gln) amidotransferase A subunit family amidase
VSGAAETVTELAAQLAAGSQTARALALRSFERLDALDPQLHAFLFTRSGARRGRRSDARCARGQARPSSTAC